MSQHITAIYRKHEAAEQAVARLLEAGFSEETTVLADSPDAVTHEVEVLFEEADQKAMMQGAVRGAVVGTVALGVLTWLAFANTPLEEVFGVVVVTGALVGGVVGSFAGSLGGLGMGEEKAAHFVDEMKGRPVLVTVHADREHGTETALAIFKETGAIDTLAH